MPLPTVLDQRHRIVVSNRHHNTGTAAFRALPMTRLELDPEALLADLHRFLGASLLDS